jgi:sulfite exporter TauE/SafE
MVGTFQLFAEGFTLGLSTGLACLSTCGPVYTTYLMQSNRSMLRYVTAVLEMSLGRFIVYILIGAIAGFVGTNIQEIERKYFTIVAYLLFSTYLLITALRTKKCDSGCKLSKWNRFTEWPIILGFISGVNICPSFLLAFSRSFVISGPLSGMMFFAAFFLGTSLFLVPVSFVGMFGKKELFRNVARLAALIVAVWFISSAIKDGYSLVKPLFDSRPIINIMDESTMYVLLENKAQAEMCAMKFAAERKGKVVITDSIPVHHGIHYILTDSVCLSRDSSKFRKPDCFTVIINAQYLESEANIAQPIGFLKEYYFRFNTKRGDVFFVR